MLSIAILVAAVALCAIGAAVLRTRRSDSHIRMPHLGARHDMVDWTLEWRRALKSLETQDPAPPRSIRRS